MIFPFYIVKHSMTFQNTTVFTFNVTEMKCMESAWEHCAVPVKVNLCIIIIFGHFYKSCKKHLSLYLSVCLHV